MSAKEIFEQAKREVAAEDHRKWVDREDMRPMRPEHNIQAQILTLAS